MHRVLGDPDHQFLAGPFGQDAVAGDDALLLVVEAGGIGLEVLAEGAGFGSFVENLGLALVKLAASGHEAVSGPRNGARGAGVGCVDRLPRRPALPSGSYSSTHPQTQSTGSGASGSGAICTNGTRSGRPAANRQPGRPAPGAGT